MSDRYIYVGNVHKNFAQFQVLKGVNFSLEKGKRYVVRGASGSGKSTLLYLLGGLDRPTSGVVSVNGQNLGEMSDSDLASYRNEHVGFVFQFHFLLSSLTCKENILLPSQLSKKVNSNEVSKFILEVADLLGVGECLSKRPFELSGGQQQRINLIRAVSLRPELLLCDEPTGSLDSINSEIVCDFLFKLSRELGITLLTVTHDRNVASRFADQFEMTDGVLKVI